MKSPDESAGTSSFKANQVYLEQQSQQLQSSHPGQAEQQFFSHVVLSLFLLALLAAYTEAPASIIAAVTPMINFFIVIFFKLIN